MGVSEAAPRARVARLLCSLPYARTAPGPVDEHLAAYGARGGLGGRLIDVVEASGLTGRGGAGFRRATEAACGRRRPRTEVRRRRKTVLRASR